jgi:hypothetical protein
MFLMGPAATSGYVTLVLLLLKILPWGLRAHFTYKLALHAIWDHFQLYALRHMDTNTYYLTVLLPPRSCKPRVRRHFITVVCEVGEFYVERRVGRQFITVHRGIWGFNDVDATR